MFNKVLVVDDNKNNIRLLTDILEDEKYEVYSTEKATEAIEMTHSNKPDIILLDIMMPEMDGFEVCKQLKSDYEIKDIPVIMVTAKTDTADLKSALDLGAFDYIKKPIDEIEVIARIQSALRFKQQQDKLKEMASKDGLTGVFNHALLIDLFEKEYLKQQRNQGDLSFVMLDIDYFKKVNDTYGHTTGDLILRELSDILSNSSRTGDIVGRYGGEEFSLVLPDTNSENAFKLCERIRKTVENYDFFTGKEHIKITVSMGICTKQPCDSILSSEMIIKADEALYIAKQNGRNQVKSMLLIM
ncbi:MAG: diguanylate cyclase response regulator [Eubacterium sp.]|nr:diguanylate cyclase response regulator [Eubacterium sp.]